MIETEFDKTNGCLMKIAIYGGSFNPPHIAHAMVINWLKLTGIVDEVWLVPVFEHAFEKFMRRDCMPTRIECIGVQLMAQDIGDGVCVSSIESELPTPSYSIDTLLALQARHPQHSFRLVVGADVVEHLPKWKEWHRIESEFSPIIVGRVGYQGHRESVQFPNISSTEIRQNLREGCIKTAWLTKSVSNYFQENLSCLSIREMLEG